MNKKILETLEFNKVKALFEPHLLTEQGLEQLKELAPTDKGDKIKQAFAEMKEMQELFVEHPHFSISATKDIAATCKRLEMGADAVLVNTAIATAQDPVAMARAFRLGVEAGRMAYEAKLAPQSHEAVASSPLTAFLFTPEP